jgi:diguanylate cyclase (GGDEF)-like protein
MNIAMDLSQKEELEIRKSIAITNMKRLVIGLTITALMEIFIIIFHDVPGIRSSESADKWIYTSYLILHGIISVLGLYFALYFRIVTKRELDRNISFYENCVYFILGIILLSITLITGLDQFTTGQIVAFGVNIIYSGLVIIIKKPYNNIMYITCFLTFIIEMIVFQKDKNILFSHLMNGAFFFVSAYFLAKFVYNNQVSHLHKNMKLEESNKKLQYLSNYDLLTEIPNRRYFKEQLEKILIDKYNTSKSYIVVMDIDFFKKINDQYGHPVGDEILKQFAKLVEENITSDDLVARFGGEEFIIFISNMEKKNIEERVDSLRKVIEKNEFKVGDTIIKITSSFGISILEGAGELNFEKAYRFADEALYQAKESGRNKIYLIKNYDT